MPRLTRSIAFAVVSAASLLMIACKMEKAPAAGGSDSSAAVTTTSSGSPGFARFVDTFFDSSFAFSPTSGTAQGFHQYDSKIEDFSAASFNRRIATLHAQQTTLDSLVKSNTLTASDSIDAAMIDGAIKSELQDEVTISELEEQPDGLCGTPWRHSRRPHEAQLRAARRTSEIV